MDYRLAYLDVFAFLWLTGWAIKAVLNLAGTERRSVSFIILGFYALYGLPIGADLLVGPPEYFAFPGFRQFTQSNQVAAIYDAFVIACPVFWWITARAQKRPSRNVDFRRIFRKIEWLLWIFLASPIVLLWLAPVPGVYRHYGQLVTQSYSRDVSQYALLVSGFCHLGIVSASGLLLARKRFFYTLAAVSPFIGLAIWLDGKRIAALLAVVLVWIAAWVRGLVTKSRVFSWGLATLLVFSVYSTWYQSSLRPWMVASPQTTYETMRVDYGRDRNFKLATYCELTGDCQILEYRGESLVFDLALAVPRSVWPGKPLTYSAYLTAVALHTRPKFLDWSITTSFLDEAIADFGWPGLLLGPLLFTILCRVGDRTSDPLAKCLTVVISCYFMVLELVAFASLAFLWGIYMLSDWWTNRQAAVAAPYPESVSSPAEWRLTSENR